MMPTSPRAQSADPGSLDLLNNLRDIHEPVAPGLWPPAPGWWLLAALLLILAAVLLLLQLHRRRRQRPIRRALAELEAWQASPDKQVDTLAELLKRAALTRYPRAQVAGLSGDAWLAFLDRSGDTRAFSEGTGRILGDDRYAGPTRTPWMWPDPCRPERVRSANPRRVHAPANDPSPYARGPERVPLDRIPAVNKSGPVRDPDTDAEQLAEIAKAWLRRHLDGPTVEVH